MRAQRGLRAANGQGSVGATRGRLVLSACRVLRFLPVLLAVVSGCTVGDGSDARIRMQADMGSESVVFEGPWAARDRGESTGRMLQAVLTDRVARILQRAGVDRSSVASELSRYGGLQAFSPGQQAELAGLAAGSAVPIEQLALCNLLLLDREDFVPRLHAVAMAHPRSPWRGRFAAAAVSAPAGLQGLWRLVLVHGSSGAPTGATSQSEGRFRDLHLRYPGCVWSIAVLNQHGTFAAWDGAGLAALWLTELARTAPNATELAWRIRQEWALRGWSGGPATVLLADRDGSFLGLRIDAHGLSERPRSADLAWLDLCGAPPSALSDSDAAHRSLVERFDSTAAMTVDWTRRRVLLDLGPPRGTLELPATDARSFWPWTDAPGGPGSP